MTQPSMVPSSNRPGQMTAVMRAMPQATGPKVLRIGLVQGGKVIEERVIKQRTHVTIGPSEKSMFVMPPPAPADVPALRARGQRLRPELPRRHDRPRRPQDRHQRSRPSAPRRAAPRSRVATASLPDPAQRRGARQGRRRRDDVPLPVRRAPAGAAEAAAPRLGQGRHRSDIDWPTTIIAAFSFLFHFGAVGSIYSDWMDPVVDDEVDVAQLLESVKQLPPPASRRAAEGSRGHHEQHRRRRDRDAHQDRRRRRRQGQRPRRGGGKATSATRAPARSPTSSTSSRSRWSARSTPTARRRRGCSPAATSPRPPRRGGGVRRGRGTRRDRGLNMGSGGREVLCGPERWVAAASRASATPGSGPATAGSVASRSRAPRATPPSAARRSPAATSPTPRPSSRAWPLASAVVTTRASRRTPNMKGSVRITAKIGPNGEVLSASPSGGGGLSGTVVSASRRASRAPSSRPPRAAAPPS
jgi:hypothetical protein